LNGVLVHTFRYKLIASFNFNMASNAVVGLGVEVLTDELGNFLLDMNKKRKKRYFWARPWILRKNKLGASETLLF
jgi:hypothetical protein